MYGDLSDSGLGWETNMLFIFKMKWFLIVGGD